LRTAAAVSSQELSIPKISMREGIFLVECLLNCVNTVLQSKKRSAEMKRLTDNGFFPVDNIEVDSIP
jgi:hypothetical protein